MKPMAAYQNGNCAVRLYRDGTKIREFNDVPLPVHPDSADVKITNYCDAGCQYCHEMSTSHGVHGDLRFGADVLTQLPAGVEIAVGGGNPLAHPQIIPFLEALRAHGIVPNITVNQVHLKRYATMLDDMLRRRLVFGLGISYRGINDALDQFMTTNTVLHLIAGVHTIADLTAIAERYPYAKVLIIGYKQVGRGIAYYSDTVTENLRQWYTDLPRFFGTSITLSFDNLAITQLGVRRFFTDERWDVFYMGDDGMFTMYIDLVKQEFAPMSTSVQRYPMGELSMQEMFAAVRSEKVEDGAIVERDLDVDAPEIPEETALVRLHRIAKDAFDQMQEGDLTPIAAARAMAPYYRALEAEQQALEAMLVDAKAWLHAAYGQSKEAKISLPDFDMEITFRSPYPRVSFKRPVVEAVITALTAEGHPQAIVLADAVEAKMVAGGPVIGRPKK